MTHGEIKKEIISNLSRRRIIEMAVRDEEKPIGALLSYIKDMYGIPKTQGLDIALGVICHYNIENRMYTNYELLCN